MAIVGERKSLMLDKEEYEKISAHAKKAGVPRPLVISTMLELVDTDRLQAKLKEVRASHKADTVETRKKRQALSSLAEDLSMEQIQALLDKLQPK